jgi:hypothetical protein
MAQLAGCGGHALVVDDQLDDVVSQALNGGEVYCVQRSKLRWLHRPCQVQRAVVDAYEVATGEHATAGGDRIVAGR